jgi:integral membrane sensor domain MASE1
MTLLFRIVNQVTMALDHNATFLQANRTWHGQPSSSGDNISPGHSSMDSDVFKVSAAISEASGNLPQSGSEENRGSVQRVSAALRPLLLFGIAYVLACRYAAGFSGNTPAPLWFPDSVLLCALLLTPRKRWLWFFLIGVPIRWMTLNGPLWLLASTYLNDWLKAVLSVYLLRRLLPGPVRLNSLRQFWIYIGIAVVGAPLLSAFAGAATHRPLGETFLPAFSRWFLGDATPALVLTPTLLYWCLDGWRELKENGVYFAALVLAVVACLYYTFLLPHADYSTIALYAPVPFLILAATRFKPVGVSTTISLLALVSILSAVQDKGNFFANHAQNSVLAIQLFLIVISIPMLFVAILIEERGIAEKDLRASRQILQKNYRRNQDLAGKLLSAQEDERKRIGRELHDDIGQRLALLSVSVISCMVPFPLRWRINGRWPSPYSAIWKVFAPMSRRFLISFIRAACSTWDSRSPCAICAGPLLTSIASR